MCVVDLRALPSELQIAKRKYTLSVHVPSDLERCEIEESRKCATNLEPLKLLLLLVLAAAST